VRARANGGASSGTASLSVDLHSRPSLSPSRPRRVLAFRVLLGLRSLRLNITKSVRFADCARAADEGEGVSGRGTEVRRRIADKEYPGAPLSFPSLESGRDERSPLFSDELRSLICCSSGDLSRAIQIRGELNAYVLWELGFQGDHDFVMRNNGNKSN